MPQARRNILIRVPRLQVHDAASFDVLQQAKILTQMGYAVSLYARSAPPEMNEMVLSKAEALRFVQNPDSVLVTHFCGFDRELQTFRRACRGLLIFRYHNVTPPRWFLPHSFKTFAYTLLGRQQAAGFLSAGTADIFMPASAFSGSELLQCAPAASSVPKVVVPVLTALEQFGAVRRAESTSTECIQALVVGRVVPSKGLMHLVHLAAAWKQQQPSLPLNIMIVGKIAPEYQRYLAHLKQAAARHGVEGMLTFYHEATQEGLLQFYGKASVLISVSEHEGFGVPIVEAQCASLPVLALDRGAVAETMGEGGVCVQGTSVNYEHMATSLRQIALDPVFRENLIQKGLKNIQRFTPHVVANSFTSLLQNS